MLEKIEAVMGKDIEGKGRQKMMEREEQYEVNPLNPDTIHKSTR